MIWKSLKEEWPYNDEVWVRYTEDGITYIERTIHESALVGITCLGIPEWRSMDAPEWMNEKQREKFNLTKGCWNEKMGEQDNL